MTKKLSSIITLLLLATTFSNYNMKRSIPTGSRIQLPNGTWIELVGEILLDEAQIKNLTQFTDLQPDILVEIIYWLNTYGDIEIYSAEYEKHLKKAANSINNLALVNKQLNTLINNPQFCLQLIHHLSQTFECSNQEVAEALQTKEAKRRLKLQYQLCNLCTTYDKIPIQNFENLLSQGADLNFTCYERVSRNVFQRPDLFYKVLVIPLIAIVEYHLDDINLLNFFLNNRANPNQKDDKGATALWNTAHFIEDSYLDMEGGGALR